MMTSWYSWQNLHGFYVDWPGMLWLLLLIPIWWVLYLRAERQRLRALALEFSHTALVAQLKQRPATWKRLLPPLGVSLLMACLIGALARPMVLARVPINSIDMMLVLDISLSMLAEDLPPDRITAAKEAAIRFVQSLPRDVRVGLEVFAGDNYVLSPPTRQHGEVEAYLRALRREDLQMRTEIGSALHTAKKILTTGTATDTTPPGGEKPSQNPAEPAPAQPDRVIVLLSDGDSHEGYPWDLAAREARAANITIHTVGIGSLAGGEIEYQGVRLPVNFDESTLRHIAELGGGSYFRALTAEDFRAIYAQIQERTVHYEEQTVDLAFILAGAGLGILLLLIGPGRGRLV